MSRYVAEFLMPLREDQEPPIGRIDQIEIDDGGQSLIFHVEESVAKVEGGDGHFFIHLRSWQDRADKRSPEFAYAHPFFKTLEGQRVRITVETL